MIESKDLPDQTAAPADGPAEVVVHDGPKSNPVALVVLLLGALFLGRRLGVNAPLIILGIAVMIFFHELGHYITAKWTGMKATEFFLGFGPTLWSFRKGETEYGLKLIPAGAYVKIIGMHNLEEVDPADEPRTYRQKSYPRRVLVASAGSVMHFIMATVLFFICFAFIGVPDENKWYVAETVEGGAAAKAGLIAGDRILSINGQPIDGFVGVGPVLEPLYDQSLQMIVLRDGQEIALTGTAGWRLSEIGAAGIDGLLQYEQVLAVEGQPVQTYADFLSKVEVGKTYNVRAFGARRHGVRHEGRHHFSRSRPRRHGLPRHPPRRRGRAPGCGRWCGFDRNGHRAYVQVGGDRSRRVLLPPRLQRHVHQRVRRR